jgi:Protein of unknown function (DUF1367)
MTAICLTKQAQVEINERDREALNKVLLGVVDGLDQTSKKGWRKLLSWISRAEVGECLQIETKFQRNSRFHRKFFALLNFAFDQWEPKRKHKSYRGLAVTKNFERFREDITIVAGHYEQTFDLQGHMVLQAKSISFAKMDDVEFEAVYSSVCDVILERVTLHIKDRAELDRVMQELVGYL